MNDAVYTIFITGTNLKGIMPRLCTYKRNKVLPVKEDPGSILFRYPVTICYAFRINIINPFEIDISFQRTVRYRNITEFQVGDFRFC